MNKELFANPDKCTGCHRCAYICSAVKIGVFAPERARIRINNYPHRGYSVPSICFQCPNAACQKACPTGAISRNADSVVVVDADACIGCGNCVAACPYGVIEVADNAKAVKCDLCGGDPACVKECFAGALVYEEKNADLLKLKGAQMKQRSTQGNSAEKRDRLGRALLAAARD